MSTIVPVRARLLAAVLSLALVVAGTVAPRGHAATGIDLGSGAGVGSGAGAGGTIGGGASPTPVSPDPIAGGPVTPAPAGTFHVWGCRTPSGAPAPTEGWLLASSVSSWPATPTGLAPCAEGGSLVLAAGAGSGVASDGLYFSAGRGLTELDGTIWRTARVATDDPSNPRFASVVTYNFLPPAGAPIAIMGDPGQTADWLSSTQALNTGLGASGSMARGSLSDPFAAANRVWLGTFDATGHPSSTPVGIFATCLSWTADWSCEARLQLWASDFRVVDANAPTVTSATGGLVDARGDLGGTISGTVTTALGGSDIVAANAIGSGIRRAVLEVDGRAVATASPNMTPAEQARCTPTKAADGLPGYSYLRPCPPSAPISLPWDSTAVADGAHTARLLLEDAAGNVAVAASGTITVRNAATIGPGSPLELRGTVNGSLTGDDGVLTVVWPSTARKASTRAQVVRSCRSAGYAAKHLEACKGRPADRSASLAWSARKLLAGRVRLVTGAGDPIVGATVQLRETPLASGASARDLEAVRTGADGTATFALPVTDGSRIVEARWFARTLDTRPAATGTALLTVAAASTLRAPARVHPGSRVRFRGQLRGEMGSRDKVPVHLEVRSGRAWKTFTTATTGSDGTWSKSLKFATTPGRYPVRVRVGTSATYPYAAGGTDDTVTVTVR